MSGRSQTNLALSKVDIWGKEQEMEETLAREEILHIFSSSKQTSNGELTIFLVTKKGSLLHFVYSLITSRVSKFTYHKFLVNFIQESVECLFIREEFPLCFVADQRELFYFDSMDTTDRINHFQLKNIIISSTLAYAKPSGLCMNHQMNLVLLHYEYSLEVFKIEFSSEKNNNEITRLAMINYSEPLSLNLRAKQPFTFSRSTENVFYFLHKIEGSLQNQLSSVPNLKLGVSIGGRRHNYLLKKIFLEKGEALSKYLIGIEIDSEIITYSLSQDLSKLSFCTFSNHLIVIMLAEALKQNKSPGEITDYHIFYNKHINRRLRHLLWMPNAIILLAVTDDSKLYIFDAALYSFKLLLPKEKQGNYVKLEIIEDLEKYNEEGSKILSLMVRKKMQEMSEGIIFQSIYWEPLVETEMGNNKEPSSQDFPLIICGFESEIFFYQIQFSTTFLPHIQHFDEYFLICAHLSHNNTPETLQILQYTTDPETWLQCFLHTGNYLLRNSKELVKSRIVETLKQMYKQIATNPEFEYFLHTVNYYYTRFSLKLCTEECINSAYKLAKLFDSSYLFKYIAYYSRFLGLETISDMARTEAQKLEGGISNLAMELGRIAEFTHKSMINDDIQNLVNDIHTIMNVESVHELDLDDFNSWEINLEEYERALEYELKGEFEKAEELYERNKLKSDKIRVNAIRKVLTTNRVKNQEPINFIELNELFEQVTVLSNIKEEEGSSKQGDDNKIDSLPTP